MAVLNIRRLPDQTHAQLRLRAAHNRRSMEAEARDILTRACAGQYNPPEGSGTVRDAGHAGLTITLSPEEAAALRARAREQGLPLDTYVQHLVARELTADLDELFNLMDDAGGNLRGQTWSRDELYRA